MTGLLKEGENLWRGERHVRCRSSERRHPGEDGGRDGSHVATSHGTGLPEAGRAKEGPSLQVLEGAPPCRHHGLGLPASITAREHISVVVSHLICGSCYSSARKPIQRHTFMTLRYHYFGNSYRRTNFIP